jgi:transposase
MLSYLTLDELAGTQSGYSAKILGQSREKGLSLMTIFALAGAMGFAIAFVKDPEARRRYVDRAPRKQRLNGAPQMLNRLSMTQRAKVLEAISWPILRRETLSEIGRKGGEQSARVRSDKISPRRRRKIAQLAARARWENS